MGTAQDGPVAGKACTPDAPTAAAAACATQAAMKRRTFVRGLMISVLATPLTAEAQPAGRLFRVGYLNSTAAAQPWSREILSPIFRRTFG